MQQTSHGRVPTRNARFEWVLYGLCVGHFRSDLLLHSERLIYWWNKEHIWQF